MAIRFSPEILQRLEEAARKTGISNKTALIKICVYGFLDYFEREGMAGLPLNWREILHDLDGRAHRYDHLKAASPSTESGTNGTNGKNGKKKKKKE